MDELLILSMVLVGVLALVAFKFRSMPLMVVSSLGWVLVSLELYESFGQDAILSMAVLWTMAFAQVLLGVKS